MTMIPASAVIIRIVVGIVSVGSISAFTVTPTMVRSSRQNAAAIIAPTVVTATAAWQGEVVSNNNNGNNGDADGRIRGCTITPVGGGSRDDDDSTSLVLATEWTVAIDGVEADLGRFSEVVYQKFARDAKQQRFQGFRPGTIPPHLEPTYRVFAMDECARETVLEALSQNSIRPFETCRSELILGRFQIPPLSQSSSKKARAAGSKKKAKKSSGVSTITTAIDTDEQNVKEDTDDNDASNGWRTYETMKEAVDAGWKPGQSYSFIATNVKGQKVKQESETSGALPVVRPF